MNVTTPTDVLARMAAAANDIPAPDPAFNFTIGWARDYGDLLAGKTDESGDERTVWDAAIRTGRVLLLGEGGAGKTSLLWRLWHRARNESFFATHVDLRRWRSELAEEWRAADDDDWRADLLLERLGTPSTSEGELELVELETQALVLIDGINEVSNRDAEQILLTGEHLARRHSHLSVVVADRLVRRDAVTSRWALARVLRADSPTGTVSGDARLLRNAFFLNLAVHGELEGDSAADAFLTYLRTHVGLDEDELVAAAAAAADAYHQTAARSFDAQRFGQLAGAAYEKLVVAGRLILDPPRAYFDHHLLHDTLAARWLAASSDRWVDDQFDALTFRASSFDALALALEQLPNSDPVDLFIRRVYDWSYYGSAYALARARQLGDVEVSRGMRVALLAMLAERRWDPVRATVDRLEDALRLIGDDLANDLLKAKQFVDVRVRIAAEPAEGELYEQWRELFLREPDNAADEKLLHALVDEESLLGWTAANVLRRVDGTPEAERSVIETLARHPSPTVRWRAAHVLGAWPTEPAIETLRSAVLNDTRWVKYGALRSLLDIAAASHDDGRTRQLDWLIKHLDEIKHSPDQVLDELERALVRVPAPEGWVQAAGEVVEALHASEKDEQDRDRWRRLAARLRDTHREQ